MRCGHEHRRVDPVRGVADAGVLPRHPRGGDGISGRGPAVGVDAKPRADPLAERVAPRRRLGRQVRLEQVPHRDALGGEDPAGRHVVEPDLRDVERIELRAGPLEQRDAEHREVEVVVLGDARDVLGEARRPARPVPGPALRDLLRQADRREPALDRPVTGRLGDRADPGPRDVLDGLPEHAAGGAAEPGSRDPAGQVARLLGRDRLGRREDLLEALRLLLRERPRQRVELVEQLERERAQLRRDRLLGGAAARARARRRPRTSAPRPRRRPSPPPAPAGARARRDPQAGPR